MATKKDTHRKTRESRKKIGFGPKQAWKNAPAVFTEHTLYIHNHPVMEDWESNYMRELAVLACSRGGRVLEVGFGMGISAGFIQQENITEHVVIEANRSVYQKLLAFASGARIPVTAMFGFWEEAVALLPSASFSGILFDTYPLSEREIHRNHFRFFSEAYRLLKPGGIFTYYSDEVSEYSRSHKRALRRAGFTHIDKRICRVKPGKDCLYWQHDTILIPVVVK